ncbi:MAG: DUF6090 family protein [Bacteroidota bacterium]
MIKFFRKIRQDLLNENAIGKYLFYALGEIILVVIGILIALSINNLNEAKQQEEKILSALQQIHSELAQSIREADEVIEYYREKDYLINLFLHNQITAADYRKNDPALTYLIVNRRLLYIVGNGFNSLLPYINNAPQKYAPYIHRLKTIFVSDRELIEGQNLRMDKIVGNILQHQSKETQWFADDYYFNTISEEAIDYFLNDAFFRNQVQNYFIEGVSNHYRHIYGFRLRALFIYRDLTELLGLEERMHKDPTAYFVDPSQFQHLLGTYTNGQEVLTISQQGKRIFGQYEQQPQVEIFPLSPNSFISASDMAFKVVQYDAEGRAIGFQRHYGNEREFFRKEQ